MKDDSGLGKLISWKTDLLDVEMEVGLEGLGSCLIIPCVRGGLPMRI